MVKGSTNPDKQHHLTRSALKLILSVEAWDREDTKVRVIDGLTKIALSFISEDEYLQIINEACEPGRREWDKMNYKKLANI
ncbi:MAG: hypothetical protein ABIC04_01015 [Nanoarchaeota archaeon]